MLPTVNAWISQILAANQVVTRRNSEGEAARKIETIEDRNDLAREMMEAATLPTFNWTINPDNGDITVRTILSCDWLIVTILSCDWLIVTILSSDWLIVATLSCDWLQVEQGYFPPRSNGISEFGGRVVHEMNRSCRMSYCNMKCAGAC